MPISIKDIQSLECDDYPRIKHDEPLEGKSQLAILDRFFVSQLKEMRFTFPIAEIQETVKPEILDEEATLELRKLYAKKRYGWNVRDAIVEFIHFSNDFKTHTTSSGRALEFLEKE